LSDFFKNALYNRKNVVFILVVLLGFGEEFVEGVMRMVSLS